MPKELVKNRHSQAPFRFPGSSVSIESACNTGDPGSIPGSGRSPGEGKGNPLQYFRPVNPVDRGAGRATGCTKPHSQARLEHLARTHSPLAVLVPG